MAYVRQRYFLHVKVSRSGQFRLVRRLTGVRMQTFVVSSAIFGALLPICGPPGKGASARPALQAERRAGPAAPFSSRPPGKARTASLLLLGRQSVVSWLYPAVRVAAICFSFSNFLN